jgi:hypothetical protein
MRASGSQYFGNGILLTRCKYNDPHGCLPMASPFSELHRGFSCIPEVNVPCWFIKYVSIFNLGS